MTEAARQLDEPASTAGHDRHTDVDAVSEAVQCSFAHCRDVAKSRAKNFFYGMKLTPEPKRSAMYTVYAFMRACDDLADEAEGDPDAHLARIARFRGQMDALIAGRLPSDLDDDLRPIAPAFAHVMATYPIRPADLHAMLDGQCDDLTRTRCATFDELYDYCYKVASTVGLVCVSVWGYEGGDDTLKLAEQRGVALQLTNIVRDVVEDAERGRCYLPTDELAECEYTPDEFLQCVTAGSADERFDRFIARQIERAYSYYDQSQDLESRLDPSCRPTCWAIMAIYRRLLDRIARDPRQVLHGRVRLSGLHKSWIGLRALARRRN